MSTNDSTPLSVDDTDAPFGGPDPDDDEDVSTRPETDGDIDEQELYDAGLASAADIEEDETELELPDGFHESDE